MLPGDEEAGRRFLDAVVRFVDGTDDTTAMVERGIAAAREAADGLIANGRTVLEAIDRMAPTLPTGAAERAKVRAAKRKLARAMDASAAILATITPSPPAGRPAPRSDAPVVPLPAVEMGPWLPWGPVADRAWLAAVVGTYAPGPSWTTEAGTCIACYGRGVAYTPAHERWRVFVCEVDRGHAAVQLRAAL